MSLVSRLQYYRRIFSAYLGSGQSQLTFWHDTPQVNPNAGFEQLGEYYMLFREKADYAGDHDEHGIPLLDYRGKIGRQYNPIAIAQWGLGNFNIFFEVPDETRRRRFLSAADWLQSNLAQNKFGVWVWNHQFDWEYRTPLKAPWYSGLAQGQGISVLVRAYLVTNQIAYLEGCRRAFTSFLRETKEGGVAFTDDRGDVWFEEYIVSPPTHILNGFIWALWGVYDYFLTTGESDAESLFKKGVDTLRRNLERYDLGFWSLYEQSGTLLPMVASPFYHQLHIIQLQIMHRLTGEDVFQRHAERWSGYARSRSKRAKALCYKGAFKLCYY